MKKTLFILIFLLSGCGYTVLSMNKIEPKKSVLDIPGNNKIYTSEIGETIVSKRILYEYDLLILKNATVGKAWWLTEPSTLQPGEYIGLFQDSKYHYFIKGNSGLAVSKTNPEDMKFAICEYLNCSGLRIFELNNKPVFELRKKTIEDNPNFVQEIIYTGRSNSIINFSYREFRNDLISPAFSQNLQYDLSTDRIIGFKNVRIEVIEATNTTLKYKVLASFPNILD